MIWFIIGGAAWCVGMFFAWSLVAINKGLPTPKPPQSNPEHSVNNKPRRHDIWE